ncbi:metallophosphoesterase [Psychrobacillus vulpis]|uniref:Phosphoesterase n=1 Tax=Psychrobacillus vulpis TaxID=2325572 RepID=A0A544TR16_9BACI|nr:metallophosphoesterase [Psychrobacillus vulpis]
MKLLIISDTHKDIETMEKVLLQHQDVDAMIHCGDSELDSSYFKQISVHVVRGNCDSDTNYPNEIITQLNDDIVYVTHGHLHQVKSTLMPLSYRAQEVQASIVCFGHSHLLGAEINNGILFVNPGSLHKPRGRKEKSYAIVEKLINGWSVLFFSSEHKIIEELNFKI